ncbi:hypothetical protein C8J27_10516 [Rhodobacter aestuarii]|uniref:Uncharacterized protein n=1 Tax=Rhodobacter aestuarii TaxID=453582 RepID=A0A1N7LRR8_9RHOB|nr:MULTISPECIES: hypothetical protein [Rhodobacter]PTV95074.1 hypothetical protein C8J27_10516 [Rhodobacter aestuarii]SIS76484.1 hypothetical protein SAMN05421580_104260 [Rhodobacter aestuarii]SOC07224.1 hypothetical protein SAMN05877809_10416 [Rhodobacter sp. JA431]
MEFLPNDIAAGLRQASHKEGRRPARLAVHAAGKVWPVLRRWAGGFSLDASDVAHLRGHVDFYEGDKHVATALIMAAEVEGPELICTTKRETPVRFGPALDFVRDNGAGGAALGYLPPI